MSEDIVERLRCHMVDLDHDEREQAAAEIERLRDELASATRHMELAEAAWLRETAGNSPVAVTLTDEEREAVLAMACHCDTRSGLEWVRLSATLRGLLDRLK